MTDVQQPMTFPRIIFGGFSAGFLATITFHQVTLWILWLVGFAPFKPYVFTAVPPLGMPAVISLAFWGGVWGILLSMLLHKLSPRAYWVKAFLFGAVFPSLVALLIVLPLKGKPLGGGWHWTLLATAFLINGAWGFGTAAIFSLLVSKDSQTDEASTECVDEVICGP